jgi:hypothetical protein
MSNLTHNQAPTPAASEVKIYGDGNSMKVHREGSFSPRELTARAFEPIRLDQGGSVYVQTEHADQSGQRQTRRFYFDQDACVYRRGDGPDDLQGVRLSAGYLDDPTSQISVGQQWTSPFGTTRGTVTAVGEAYADALLDPTDPSHRVNHPTSPIMRGRELLDRVSPAATAPAPLLPPKA